MTFIPDEKIDEIRRQSDIIRIISEYVHLKKTGKNYKGLCPFHSEKTPSFTVNEDKQIFYCFGCHTGGNVITFLMRHENMSFPETVRHLAKRYGIEIPEDERGKGQGARGKSENEVMFSVNQTALEFFIKNLFHDSRGAQTARDYLKKRGLTDDIVREFKIGYAPDSWNSLLDFLRYKKFPLALAEKTGLIIKKQSSTSSTQYYDRFRNRLMFPIMDVQGRVIGFGARTLGSDDAKYLNSPESVLFKKGEVFYGIHQAKAAISKTNSALIVEGYFDLIALHQYGFKNSVATMGTALTENHLRKLRNYAGEVYALFDGDDAGRLAALRGVPLFILEDAKAKIVLVPHGIDPDDLLRKHGKDALEKCIKEAHPFMDFLLEETKKRFDTSSSSGKIGFIVEIGGYLAKLKNDVERNFYIEKTAHLMQVDRDVVKAAVKTAIAAKSHKSENRGVQQTKGMLTDKAVISKKFLGTKLAEETILKILVFYPDLCSQDVRGVIENFKDRTLLEAGKFLMEKIGANTNSKFCPADIIDEISDEDIRQWFLKTSVSDAGDIQENPVRILDDCCRKIISNNIDKEEAKRLLKQVKEADRTGNRNLFEKAARQFIEKKKNL